MYVVSVDHFFVQIKKKKKKQFCSNVRNYDLLVNIFAQIFHVKIGVCLVNEN